MAEREEERRVQHEETEARSRELRKLPPMPLERLPEYLRGEYEPDRPLGQYTGIQVAQAAIKAGFKPKDKPVRPKSFMRAAKFEPGWPAGSTSSGDGDIESASTSRYLTISGTLYESYLSVSKHAPSSSWLKILKAPHEIIPHDILRELAIWWSIYGSAGLH